jgi:predicted DNA-binding protein (MmcQ/YjbR family)
MSGAELRAACLTFAGAGEEFPFHPSTSVFKVAGKVFAISPLAESPLRVSLKCDPDLALTLRAGYPAITPGYHLNKKHWNTVLLDGSVPAGLVRDMIEDSYDLVVAGLSRRRQEQLGWVELARGEPD